MYTGGIYNDGIAFWKDGVLMTSQEVLEALNKLDQFEKENESILKVGDVIQWSFDDDRSHPKMCRGRIFQSEIAHVDLEDKVYCVYCMYGQDKIPFNQAKFIRHGVEGTIR